MSGASLDLTEDSSIGGNAEITVPASDRTGVTVIIDMSAYGETLDEIFPNGIYIEGFVHLKNLGDDVHLSTPYLGFYDNWSEALIIDSISVSPNNDVRFDAVDAIYTGLLRNCRTITYTVTNAETGEVIMMDMHEFVRIRKIYNLLRLCSLRMA